MPGRSCDSFVGVSKYGPGTGLTSAPPSALTCKSVENGIWARPGLDRPAPLLRSRRHSSFPVVFSYYYFEVYQSLVPLNKHRRGEACFVVFETRDSEDLKVDSSACLLIPCTVSWFPQIQFNLAADNIVSEYIPEPAIK